MSHSIYCNLCHLRNSKHTGGFFIYRTLIYVVTSSHVFSICIEHLHVNCMFVLLPNSSKPTKNLAGRSRVTQGHRENGESVTLKRIDLSLTDDAVAGYCSLMYEVDILVS